MCALRGRRFRFASTIPLEPANVKTNRFSGVVGIFLIDTAIAQLVGTLVLKQDDEHTVR